MNRVSLVGRITKDPEVRYSQNSNNPILGFTIAVDRGVKDANGQRLADFINCVAFNQTADFMSRYIKKGFLISVCGRLQSRSYQGADGQTRYVTEVICEQVENLTPRDPNAQPQQNVQPQYNQPQYAQPQYQQNNSQYQGFGNPQHQNPQPTYRPQNISNNDVQAQPDSFEVPDDDLPF